MDLPSAARKRLDNEWRLLQASSSSQPPRCVPLDSSLTHWQAYLDLSENEFPLLHGELAKLRREGGEVRCVKDFV